MIETINDVVVKKLICARTNSVVVSSFKISTDYSTDYVRFVRI
jgi:hypothetical protein